MTFTFTDDVVRAVVRHMNDDHADDQLAIVRSHARPDAIAARLAGVDAEGLAFDVTVPGGMTGSGHERVLLPWPMPITERADIRRAVVALMPSA